MGLPNEAAPIAQMRAWAAQKGFGGEVISKLFPQDFSGTRAELLEYCINILKESPKDVG